MSYAIETKKRKFDRILESLTDNSSSSTRALVASKDNNSRISVHTTSNASSLKKRKFDSFAKPAPTQGHFLPSSRSAFLQRLSTFREVTEWHVRDKERINAAEWAKRGWERVSTDTVGCAVCNARLLVDIDTHADNQRFEQDGTGNEQDEVEDVIDRERDIHNGIVVRFAEMIVTAHTETCPWRRRGCDSTIQRIEGLLNTKDAISALSSRYNSIVQQYRGRSLPTVTTLPNDENVDEPELERFRLNDEVPDMNAMRLAVAGWQASTKDRSSSNDVLNDTLSCPNCFRSLGMWLYRGSSPTVETLDGVMEHLEYCPWASSVAQTTEISVQSSRLSTLRSTGPSIATKVRVPGWVLVCMAVARDNHSKGRSTPSTKDIVETQQQSPEQREKKNKDLTNRIKDLKKTFNVKSLLKRNNTKERTNT